MQITPKNPFVYGRILAAADPACSRPELELRIKQTIRDDARLALIGERRMGKSSLVQRTLESAKVPMLRINYHEVVDLPDAIMRTIDPFERFIRERSLIARNVVPWMREVAAELREIRAQISTMEIKAALGVPSDHLGRVWGYIHDVAARKPFAIFIDELQDLRDRLPNQQGSSALAIIRDAIQRSSKCPVFYAGSGRASFTLLFTSEASPFYEQAPLAVVTPIPGDVMLDFITAQFSHGHKIARDAALLILRIAGDLPNDIQRLCYETWNEHLTSAAMASVETVQRGFDNVMRDLAPFGEKWIADLSTRQLRAVFAVAFLEHAGASTAQFMEFAGQRNPGAVNKALAPVIKAPEPLLEKTQSRYRFRSRFARIWFALCYYRVQALVPAMRLDAIYRRYLEPVLPPLPSDPLRPQP